MKSTDCQPESPTLCEQNGNDDESEEVTDFLINSNKKEPNLLQQCNEELTKTYKILKNMGRKTPYQKILLKNNVTQDTRSQSLPNCLLGEEQKQKELKSNNSTQSVENKESTPQLLQSNPQSPTKTEQWFKTWPERCDKIKSNEPNTPLDTPNSSETCVTSQTEASTDTVDCSVNIKNKFTLNDALQNISLAYSPITKQLHLVEKEKPNEYSSNENKVEFEAINNDTRKKGHKRTEAGSFSSTISSLSDPSASGSLLDADDRSTTSFEETIGIHRKKSLTGFFTKNIFSSWKLGGNLGAAGSAGVWKLFSKPKESTGSSPLHGVASSSALIQLSRPPNLPAKTQEEDQRHREEYKAIVAAAKKKDAETTAAKQKLQKIQLEQEEQQAVATRHFSTQALGHWDSMSKSKKTRDLWWQGLPSSVRGKVWRLAIGNELNVSPQLYEICVSRAQNRLNSSEPSHCDSDIDQESSMDVIQLDISRTFPHLCIFQEGGPYSDILHSLLAAYVCYRPDVGYVQGMSYIAAILILNMEAFDAFICFANLLNQPLHLAAFTLNQEQMDAYYNAYNEVFLYNLPKLYRHFEVAHLTPDLYLLDWIYTVFAKSMPLDVACRVWDIFLRDGYEFLFRTALGILHLNQDVLINMDFLHGAQFLTRLPDGLSSDQLFKSIQTVSTSIGKQSFYQIVEKCSSIR